MVARSRRNPFPTAIVFDCKGAAEGAISVVRTLGRRGVHVVVLGDDPRTPTARSRYCKEFLHVPEFTRRPDETLTVLRRFAERRPLRPVLFPTADPDLALVSALRSELESSCSHFLARPDLVTALSDKREFLDFARKHRFPVPATFAPASAGELRRVAADIRYPVVLKPSHPAAWTDTRVQEIVNYCKALVIESRAELISTYDAVAQWNTDLIVQEWIPGNDDAHHSLHVYLDRHSRLLAVFTGRKVRVYPAYAGSGCFVRSVRIQPLIEAGVAMLQQIGYTGIAVVNFKQDARTGEFIVHEINPRISQWNILATRCGVDIPWIAYADAAGLQPDPAPAQSERWRYVYLRNDLKAFAAYRRNGDWTPLQYLASLLGGPRVHQLLAFDDPMPLFIGYRDSVRSRLRELRRLDATPPTAATPPAQPVAHQVPSPDALGSESAADVPAATTATGSALRSAAGREAESIHESLDLRRR